MKSFRLLLGLSMFVALLIISSCDPGDSKFVCGINTFFWEGELYHASYNNTGRLTKLQSDDSKVLFFYDEDNKLYKSEIYLPGELTAAKVYTFENGPYGITRMTYYQEGELTHEEIFKYASATKMDSVIYQEYYLGEVTFINRLKFEYTGGNVTKINPMGNFNRYTTFSFDNKKNPFKMLGAAVGNPVFFPVGLYVFFPVSTYDISYVSRFSENNQITAEYAVPFDSPNPEMFTYDYTYTGDKVKTIHWTNDTYGGSEDYAFTYKCACLPR